MNLLFDTSALLALTDEQAAALPALLGRGHRLCLPSPAVFELRNRRPPIADGGDMEPLDVLPAQAEWMRTAEALGAVVEVLPFTAEDAEALAAWLKRKPQLWFERQKLHKAWSDGAAIRRGAFEALREGAHSSLNAEATDTHALNKAFSEAAVREIQGGSLAGAKSSATIDWLHLGIALRHNLRLVHDDSGIEFRNDQCVSLPDLLDELGVPHTRPPKRAKTRRRN